MTIHHLLSHLEEKYNNRFKITTTFDKITTHDIYDTKLDKHYSVSLIQNFMADEIEKQLEKRIIKIIKETN